MENWSTWRKVLSKILYFSITGTFLISGCSRGNQDSNITKAYYAGALNGTFSVNTSGAGNYEIPLSVPQARGNLTPNLSLQYTSTSGNGLIGVGFSMSGLSKIQRVKATKAQDGFKGSINYDENDRYSLNGSRLVAVNGNYGEDSTIYHTENQSWKKVISYGVSCGNGPCYFKVITKKGYALELGKTNDSRIESTNGKGIRVWAVNRITDLHGNYVEFSYIEDTLNGSYYPKKISYTGNSTIGIEPFKNIFFDYQNRQDTITVFEGGGRVTRVKRLKSISTQVGNEHVLNYQLQYVYSPTSNRSLLKSIKECDSANRCLPPTSFNYQQSASGFYDSLITDTTQLRAGQLIPIDINGDGLVDIADIIRVNEENNPTQLNSYLSNGLEYHKNDSVKFQNDSGGNFYGVDVNGDGLGDIIKIYLNEKMEIDAFLSNGEYIRQSWSYKGPDSVNYGTNDTAITLPADINGDGRTDIILAIIESYNDSSKIQLTNFISTGSGFINYPSQQFTFASQTEARLSISDINGDGLSDLIYTSSSDPSKPLELTPLFSQQGKSFCKGEKYSSPLYGGSDGQIITADINGDGLGDIIYSFLRDSTYLTILRSTGTHYEMHKSAYPYYGDGWLIPVEYTGDKLTDLLFVNSTSSSGFTFNLFTSNGFNFEFPIQKKYDSSAGGMVPLPLDINGDQQTDLLLREFISGDISHFKLSRIMATSPYPDLMDTISNSIGGIISLQHKSLTDSTVYSRGDNSRGSDYTLGQVLNNLNLATYAFGQGLNGNMGSTFPIVTVTLPKYVVSSYIKHDGRGNQYPYYYHYSDARVDRNGRGWLGFAQQTFTDNSVGNITKTYYHQLFPLSGKTDSIFVISHKGELMHKFFNTYSSNSKSYGKNRRVYTVNRTSDIRETYDYDSYAFTLRKDYHYDEFGNVTVIKNHDDIEEDRSVYTLSDYYNDTVSWRLGYLRKHSIATDSIGYLPLSSSLIIYDTINQNILKKRYLVSDDKWIDSSYVYDAFGNNTFIIDPAADSTQIVYDSIYFMYPVKHISPPNQWCQRLVSQNKFDASTSRKVYQKDPNGIVTKWSYDGIGRLKGIYGQSESGQSTQIVNIIYQLIPEVGYSVVSKKRANWDGSQWSFVNKYYDGIVRNYIIESEGFSGELIRQQQEFNSFNKVSLRSYPYLKDSTIFWSKWEYDPYKRIKRVTHPLNENDSVITIADYNKKSIIIHHAYATDQTYFDSLTFDYFNSKRQFVSQLNPNGELSITEFDPLGRIKVAKDPKGIPFKIWYDNVNRPIRTEDPSFGSRQYIHNDSLRIVHLVDNNLDTIHQYRDSMQRIISSVSSRDGTKIDYQYDRPELSNSNGRLGIIAENNEKLYEYSYDQFGNKKSIKFYTKDSVLLHRFIYRPNGKLEQILFPDKSTQYFNYNKYGYLQSISLFDQRIGNEEKTMLTFAAYNANKQPTKLVYGNSLVETRNFIPSGKIQSHRLFTNENEHYINKKYHWDYRYHIASIIDLSDSIESQYYNYSPSGRLLESNNGYDSKSYLYDSSGNLIKKALLRFKYENYQVKFGIDEIYADTVFKASYNNLGQRSNSVIKKYNEDSTYFNYKYDPFKRLSQIEKNGGLLYTFNYDHSNRRIRKIDFDTNTTIDYISPYYEISLHEDSVVCTKNIKGPEGIIASVAHSKTKGDRKFNEHASSVLYFHSDQVRSTKLTTTSSGQISSRMTYTPYGEIYDSLSTGPENFRYTYSGKELDRLSDLYYFDARYYDPLSGRFITPDTKLGGPAKEVDVLNRYAFALNNPISNADPSGHSIFGDIVTAIVTAITAVAEVALDVVTAGAAIPAEVAIDGSVISAEVGAETASEIAIQGATESALEGSTEGMTEESVDSATESLADCDCGKVNEQNEAMCFVSGTVVFTKSGMTPIEELAVGDSIWTSNSDTKKSELAAITVVSTQVSSRQLVIGSNCSEVHTTLNHPFLVNEEWLPASSIQIGDSLTSIDDKKIYINKISRVSEDRLVYNLTLSENHNFWVGSEKFLVHNGGCFSKGVSLDDGEEDVANNVIARHAEYGDATPQANNSMQLEVAGREDFEMYISSTTSNRTYWISMADGPKGAGLGCVNWVYIGENADVDFIGASNALFGADENVWQPLGMLYRDQAIAEGFPSEVTDEMRTSDMVGRTEDVLRNAKSRATEKGWIFQ